MSQPSPNTPGEPLFLGASPPGSDPAGRPAPSGRRERTVAERLVEESYAFDFFQAVRLLERINPQRRLVGRAGPPAEEVARFRAHLSLSFPPSAIYELQPASALLPPAMTVAFMGLTGPSGVLPVHYTELLLRLQAEAKGPEKNALRAWLDLFNHRLISLFYRAWEKYRFYVPYERGEHAGREPDPFTCCLLSLVGLGAAPLRNRLRVCVREADGERVLRRLPDLALLHYAGFFAQRARNVSSLEALLRGYFGLPVDVRQFQGQWLPLDIANRSRIGTEGGHNALGVDVVAGDRVWDVQGKFRIRLGPLRYAVFTAFLPDRAPVRERKAFFLLCHLVRLYAGPDLDFDVQLVLKAEEVPECQLPPGGDGGPRLGWDTWLRSETLPHDAEDAVFEGEEPVVLNEAPPG
jgi:type VI secretion system protein ImpH